MMNSQEKADKLYQAYTLVAELLLQYPESLDEVLSFLLNAKEFYKDKRDYQTQKSIKEEYVVFEELIETTNG